jgi:class 3 adenylate cyclase
MEPIVDVPEVRYMRSGEVLVSSTVRDLVAGSGIVFEDRGVYELKGVPDAWRLFRAVPPASDE